MLLGFPPRLTMDSLNHHSNIYRALIANPGTAIVLDEERVYARNFEVPSGGGVGTARGIAHAYSDFATGGRELRLCGETLELLAAPAIPPEQGFHDECLHGEVQFSLGFMKPSAAWLFGNAASFGSPGSGGSLGFADPVAGVGYAYVTTGGGASRGGLQFGRDSMYERVCAAVAAPTAVLIGPTPSALDSEEAISLHGSDNRPVAPSGLSP
jgi:hypothetical protein